MKSTVDVVDKSKGNEHGFTKNIDDYEKLILELALNKNKLSLYYKINIFI